MSKNNKAYCSLQAMASPITCYAFLYTDLDEGNKIAFVDDVPEEIKLLMNTITDLHKKEKRTREERKELGDLKYKLYQWFHGIYDWKTKTLDQSVLVSGPVKFFDVTTKLM